MAFVLTTVARDLSFIHSTRNAFLRLRIRQVLANCKVSSYIALDSFHWISPVLRAKSKNQSSLAS